jgi:CheY-like chemotaxis protein
MEYALKDLGCTVSSAGTVAGALALAAERRFDLLISDIGLPDAPGTVLMRELRARHALKGIAMSGYGRDGDLEQSRDAGFDAHLVKPVTLDALEEAIRRLLG